MNEGKSRVAAKIAKKLKSSDDNDKLAALAYLTKLFESPEELVKSESASMLWQALRSTHFLERAIRSPETSNLVFVILSVFCHACDFKEMEVFLPHLIDLAVAGVNDALTCLVEMSQSANDVAPLFESFPVREDTIMLLSKCLQNSRSCSATPAVFRARERIFGMLTGREDLCLRRHLFLVVSSLIKANDALAILRSPNSVDLSSFLAAERLAFIELRLQLDIPLNYQELEQKEKSRPALKFTQKIGPLLNPDLSAASCEVLEILLRPLINHEEDLSDSDIDQYFDTVNTIIKDSVAIFVAAEGTRDRDRVELQCLISIFGMWLMQCQFLCHNSDFLRELTNVIRLLAFFPKQAIHMIPAFSELGPSKLPKSDFLVLAEKMQDHLSPEESAALASIVKALHN